MSQTTLERALLKLSGLAGLALGGAAFGQTDATWVSAQSGSWFDATRWSTNPSAPNNDNPPGSLYRAIINATGSTYAVTLPSSVTLSSLRLDSSNASVQHTGGVFDLVGTADIVRGNWFLNGGTIRGGTISFTNATSRLRLTTSRQSTLDGVRLSGTTTLGDANGYVGFRNNLTLSGNVVSIAGNGFQGEFLGSQSLSSGTLRFNNPAGQTSTLAVSAGNTLTVAADAAIEGSGVVGGAAGSTLVNAGRFTIASNTRRLTVSVPTLTNTGTMEATAGGVLDISSSLTNSGLLRADVGVVRLAGTFVNNGTIVAQNNGTIDFAGTIRADSLGTINSTGGTLRITGTLDNTGNNFRLDSTSPNWDFAGTLRNGTVTLADNRELVVASDGVNGLRAILDGARVVTPAVVRGVNNATNPTVVLRNGAGFDSSVLFSNSGTILIDRSGEYSAGSVTFQGNGSVNAISSNEAVNVTFAPTTTFAISPGGTLAFGQSVSQTSPQPSIAIRGAVTGSGAGTIVRTPVSNFRNEGLIDLSNGARLELGNVAVSGADATRWSNAGTIRVRDGTVNLAGQFNASDLASTDFTGSAVSLSGTLNNVGSTLTFGGAGGRWSFGGGEIVGGTVQLVGDNPVSFATGNSGPGSPNITLDGTTITGNLSLGGRPSTTTPFGKLALKRGLNLNGTISGGGGSWVRFIGSGTFASGTIDLRGPGESSDDATLVSFAGDGTASSGTLTIAPGAIIRGTQFAISGDRGPSFLGTIVNRGLISSDTPGGSIGLGAAVFRNEGIIEATNGGAISLSEGFENAGTLRVNRGGVLNIAASGPEGVRLLPSTTWVRGSGTVNLRGVLNNTGQVLTLDSASGYFAARGGSVRGGEINIFAGGGFNLSGVGIGTGDASLFGLFLQSTTVNGDIVQPYNGAPLYMSDATVHGTVTLRGRQGLRFQPMAGTIDTIRGGTFFLDPQTGGGFTEPASIGMTSSLTLTLSPTTFIHGGGPSDSAAIGSIYGTAQGTTIVNQGRISADESGQNLTIRSNTFRNEGILEAINGGIIAFTSDTGHLMSNPSGVLRVSGGGQIRLGRMRLGDLGMYDSNDGRITLAGMVDNTNNTFTLSPTGGSLYFGGPESRITGGTIASSGSSWLKIENGLGWLTNCTLVGDVLAGDGGQILAMSSLALNGTIHLAGSGASLTFGGTQTLNSGTISFEGTTGSNRILRTDASLTLGPDVVVRGGRGTLLTSSSSALVNNGRISADVTGQSISIHLARFTNNGTVEAINGGEIIFVPPSLAPDPVIIVNSGLFSVVPGSRIDIGGEFVQSSSGTLQFAITSDDGPLGTLWTTVLFAAGTLRVTVDPDVVATEGSTFRFVLADRIEGRFDRMDLPRLDSGLGWDLSALYTSGTIRVVPTPSVGMLALVGLGLLGRGRRTLSS